MCIQLLAKALDLPMALRYETQGAKHFDQEHPRKFSNEVQGAQQGQSARSPTGGVPFQSDRFQPIRRGWSRFCRANAMRQFANTSSI